MNRLGRALLFLSALVLGLTAVHPLKALTCEVTNPLLAGADFDDDSYSDGTHAMDDQRWEDAVKDFDHVVALRGSRSDAALYWKAYSLQRLSNDAEAVASCHRLRAQFAASTWNKECTALFLSARPTMAGLPRTAALVAAPVSSTPLTPGTDVDLRLLALNSLLHQEPSRAVPVLREILSGNQLMSLKRQAIFVLAQSRSPEASAVLNDAVVGKLSVPLQEQAIQMIGIFQGQRANDTLAQVYRTSSDLQVKKAVVSAFFLSQDSRRLVDLARTEKDLQLKRFIVSQLAVMNDTVATDYMLELLK